MDISIIRRMNLKKFISEYLDSGKYKNYAEFCTNKGLEASYLSQILNGHRNIGERSARNLELKIGLSQKSLDNPTTIQGIKEQLQNQELPVKMIPILTMSQAKKWREYVKGTLKASDYTFTDYSGSSMDQLFCVLVNDPSMFPRFQIGDKLIIDPTASPEPSDFVLAESEDNKRVFFNKYRILSYTSYHQPEFELIPLNPDFPSITSTEHLISIIGVAVVHIQTLK